MNLPDHYKNLDINQKKVIIADIFSQIWNNNFQWQVADFNEEQIDFLFTYFFTESKEEREKMRHDMWKKYETSIKDLKAIAERLQKLDLRFAELLAQREDTQEFMKIIQ